MKPVTLTGMTRLKEDYNSLNREEVAVRLSRRPLFTECNAINTDSTRHNTLLCASQGSVWSAVAPLDACIMFPGV